MKCYLVWEPVYTYSFGEEYPEEFYGVFMTKLEAEDYLKGCNKHTKIEEIDFEPIHKVMK